MVQDHRTGISPTDLVEMRRIFDEHLPTAILRKAHAFHWNNTTKEWELYRIPNIEGTGDRIARCDGTTWVED